MANTGEIQDLTVSWEGYAGSSVEAFIKKEFTSTLKGEVGVEISGYRTEGGILPVSNVYTYQGSPITPIVVIEDRALGGSTKLYFPIYKAYYSFEPYTEKLEYYVFEYRSGYEVETGYYYIGTEDNLPSWVDKQNVEKLPVATTTNKGLMSSADKTKLDNAASISALNEKADKTTVKENERVIAEALNDLESKKANTNDVYTKAQTDSAISEYTYDKTATDNLLNNKVDKVEGKGLSTNDFKVIKLNDYLTKGDALPTDANLIYTYHGQVVEKRMCQVDADNEAILFIADRTVSDGEMDNLTVLVYIQSGGGDYAYEYVDTYYTNNSDCPKWVKSACGIIYANSENAGLMPPSVYDDLLTLNEKADKTTVRENERVVAEALNDLESRKANTNDVYTKTQTDNLVNAKADTTALGGLTLVKLTQAEYDALTTKDSNKLYIIVG